MAKYPIKLLKDESNTPFVPLVSTDCIRDKDNQTLQEILNKKLSPTNLLGGEYVNVTTEGDNCYISVDLPNSLKLVNNLTTAEAGQGALDASQGKILKDSIPTIVDDLTSTDKTKVLSANQGYVLNNKLNNYLPLHGIADKAATVGNLVIRSKSMSWGTLTEQNGYTIVNAWDSPADGGITLSDKDKRLSIQIDGYFYQQEGQHRVLDTSDLGNYAFYKWPSGSIILSKSGTASISKELTITTKGRPVYISVSGDNNPTTDSAWFNIYFYRDNKMISQQIVESHGSSWNIPFSMQYLDTVDAGSHTYKVEFAIGAGSTDLNESKAVQSPNFTVFEI